MKRFIGLLCLLLAPAAWATTTVTGKIQTLGTGNVTSGAFVRFWLRGCAGNQPRVNGTSVIGSTQGGVFFFDIAADSAGNTSGTIYSTRNNAGTGNGDIECGGSLQAVWYGMQVFVAGKGGPEMPVHAKSGATLDITQVTPITTNPVITAPTGDSTYLRLDAGNSPVTGNVNFTGAPGVAETNAGVVTNLAMNEYLTSLLGGINLATEFGATQAGNFSTDALAGGAAAPVGATVHNINGLAGYVNTSCNSLTRTVCNTVGVYTQARNLSNGSAAWASNFLSQDAAGLSGHHIINQENDLTVNGTPTFVRGISSILAGNGTMPADSIAFELTRVGTTVQWNRGIWIRRGTVSGTALELDGLNSTFPTNSNRIALDAYDGANALQQSSMSGNPTAVQFNPPLGNAYFLLNSGGGIQLPGSTSGTSTIAAVPLGGGGIGLQAVAFASLGTPANGSFAYCNDCTIANPCAGAGTGALAKRLNGAWVCN